MYIEIGCGNSVHGLRPETSLLMSEHHQSGFGQKCKLVRISPYVVTTATTDATVTASAGTSTDINAVWTGDGNSCNERKNLPGRIHNHNSEVGSNSSSNSGRPSNAMHINAGALETLKKIYDLINE